MLSSYASFTLANGLRVLTIPMPGVSSVTVMAYVGAGSRYEVKDKIGLSHFVEHMIFKGTKKRPSTFDIGSAIDSVGGENNAFTAKDHTAYYIKVQNGQIELAFDLLSDVLLSSLFLEEEIEKEKLTIIEEINMYEDAPFYKIEDVFYSLVFGDTPLGWFEVGTKESVRSLRREDFLDYVERFYQGKDMVLAVAGKVNKEAVRALAEEYFSTLKKGRREKLVEFKESQDKSRVSLEHKKTDQVHFHFGYPAFSYTDPDRNALNVLSTILGGGISSRLFIEVREKRGLAYDISSSVDLYGETGVVGARGGLNLARAEEAIAVILAEFEKIKDEPVGESELQKAKDFLKGRISLRLENSRSVATWYGGKELLEGKVETPAEVFAQFDQVTAKDVQRVAKRLFNPQKRNLAIIGPFKDEEKFLQLIK